MEFLFEKIAAVAKVAHLTRAYGVVQVFSIGRVQCTDERRCTHAQPIALRSRLRCHARRTGGA
jgi:hypothetical protein